MSWGIRGFCKCGVRFTEDNCPVSVLKKGRGLCRKCNSLRMALWKESNPDKSKTYKRNRRKERSEDVRTYDKKYYHNVLKNDPEFLERRKAYHRKTVFGMTNDAFESLLKSQDNQCAICHKAFDEVRNAMPGCSRTTICVDHNHITDETRGLLCGSCNKGLGHFFENQEVLLSAIAYLKRYENTNILEQRRAEHT